MKILVDAFGGDNAPLEVIKGSVEALKENKDFILEELLNKFNNEPIGIISL